VGNPRQPSQKIRTNLTGLNNSKHFGLARAINKAGFASRSKAEQLVSQGHVSWNGRIVRDPEWGTTEGDAILVDGQPLAAERKIYLMCHKPKGLVTTADDNKGRPTVFQCLEGLDLPHVGPVGRLDMASEGLLLFTNDTRWAAALLDPANRVPKTYHVQIDGAIDEAMMELMTEGVVDAGEKLQAVSVQLLREGEKNRWIEIVLQEGKNREIRRMLKAFGLEVLRLIRIRIGDLPLGDLPKGAVRHLTEAEVEGLRQTRTLPPPQFRGAAQKRRH
jgi:23S rRNA pseudouridine2605 synthase